MTANLLCGGGEGYRPSLKINRAPCQRGGFASPVEHFVMMQDTVRVSAYRRAIFRHCKDRMVVEIGWEAGKAFVKGPKQNQPG